GAPSAAAAPVDQRELGHVRQQPAGEVLRDHEGGAETAGRGNRELAADCGAHRPPAPPLRAVTMRETLLVLWSRIGALFTRDRLDTDFAQELDSHLGLSIDDYVRRGFTRDEAARAARLDLGGAMQLTEHHREQRGLPFVDTTLQDLRYAGRTLRRN